MIERHNLFANKREKRSLIFYCDTKFEWTRNAYSKAGADAAHFPKVL
jgi:hypothetical protein